MGKTTNGLIKPLTATAAVAARRFVKAGAADGTGVTATDATATILGVSADIDTDVGERISCQMVGNIAEIVYGGPVTRGDKLTADAQGRAVTTTTTGANYGGTAEVSGVLGDIGTVIVAPGFV